MQALFVDVLLQPGNHFAAGLHLCSEDEIISFSGVSKSSVDCINHAGGGRIFAAGGVELQPLTASSNIRLKPVDRNFLALITCLGRDPHVMADKAYLPFHCNTPI